MAGAFGALRAKLKSTPKVWLVSGVAGFIGSHLLEELLGLGQVVRGLDNFSTGRRTNLDEVHTKVGSEAWRNFSLVEGDLCDECACREALQGVEVVLHQAAFGSVPRSISDPVASNACNVGGFLNLVWAAKHAGVKRFVYASSSAVYGDSPELPKREEHLGMPLSPYAVTKLADELYAGVFARLYEMEFIGLRYFNVFGPRQDPDGPYAAVIPRWIKALLRGEDCVIFGDGETSRDFCYVANAVQANILAGAARRTPEALNRVFNVSYGKQTTLNQLFGLIRDELERRGVISKGRCARHTDFRAGDVRHSCADISAIKRLLGYEPEVSLAQGLHKTLDWYLAGVRG